MATTVRVVCPHCDAVNRLPSDRDARGGKCGRCKERLFEGKPVALDAERLRRHLINSDIPLVLDFWAAWCGPCRALAPVFERAAQALEPRARFVKIDADAEQQLAAEFGVRGIPALFLIRQGKVEQQHAGLADVSLFERWLAA